VWDCDEEQREANTALNILAIIKWLNAIPSIFVIVRSFQRKCKTRPTTLTFLKQLVSFHFLNHPSDDRQ